MQISKDANITKTNVFTVSTFKKISEIQRMKKWSRKQVLEESVNHYYFELKRGRAENMKTMTGFCETCHSPWGHLDGCPDAPEPVRRSDCCDALLMETEEMRCSACGEVCELMEPESEDDRNE